MEEPSGAHRLSVRTAVVRMGERRGRMGREDLLTLRMARVRRRRRGRGQVVVARTRVVERRRGRCERGKRNSWARSRRRRRRGMVMLVVMMMVTIAVVDAARV